MTQIQSALKFEESSATDLLCFQQSPIHGIGAFAKVDLRSGMLIIEYAGERIDKSESLRRCQLKNEYIFCLNDDWDLDGNIDSNLARFINHSCSPNCDAERIQDQIWIVARQPIKVGEEVTFNYGYDLDDYREHPCHCGSPACVGFIVGPEFFDQIRAATSHRQF